MIKDAELIPLKKFVNEQGEVGHILKATDRHFTKFGEVYYSSVKPGVIKGWHKSTAIRYYAVIKGDVKVVLFDGLKTQEFELGERNYSLLKIPKDVWSSFKAVSKKEAILIDIMDEHYKQENNQKADINSLNDYWAASK